MKQLYIIAGCNGAGKTTASFNILKEYLDCDEFVNADEIAKGLSPLNPDAVAFKAGRIMINRIDDLMHEGVSFAFETTLASKSHITRIKNAKEMGYQINMLFFWLSSADLAVKRVALRVEHGGHNIPENVIRRRYILGVKYLFSNYYELCDELYLYDNSEGLPQLIAEFGKGSDKILNLKTFNFVKQQYERS